MYFTEAFNITDIIIQCSSDTSISLHVNGLPQIFLMQENHTDTIITLLYFEQPTPCSMLEK
jgi:hypothetical protein